MKILNFIKDIIWPTLKKAKEPTYRVMASTVMYSPRLKSFYQVDSVGDGSRIVRRMYGEGHPGDFVMMLKHNEPLFVCDYTGEFTEDELKMILLLYKF